MFGGSSTQASRYNSDGSNNVHCSQCGEFIGRSYIRINRALCVICQAAENGMPLTEEAIRMYKLSKAERVDVTYLAIEEPSLKALGVKKKWNMASVAGEFLHAVGNFAQGVKVEPATGQVPSADIAKSKRRKRLFEDVDLEQKPGPVLGSMEEVDALSKKGQ